MKTDWWTALSERTQRYADMGDMRASREALKTVYGPSHQIQPPLRFSDGSSLLTDKEAILQRWSEHFKGLLSNQSTLCESSLAKIPQVDVKLELDDPPTREENKKATMQLKVSKSPDIDGIPAEVCQYGGDAVLDKLQNLFFNCWEKRTLPEDLRDAISVFLCKTREKKHTVQAMEASLCSPLQAKSWLAYC